MGGTAPAEPVLIDHWRSRGRQLFCGP